MTTDEKTEATREFFLAPKPLLHVKSIVVGTIIVLLGLVVFFEGSTSAGGLFLGVGVVWALCLPLRPKRKGNEAENEVQYFSVVKYNSAKERFEARPELSQIVAWLKEGLANVEEHSALRLGLDDTTHDPVVVAGPLYDASVGSDDPAKGFDKKDVLRRKVEFGEEYSYFYSTFRLSVFQFTENFLGSYQANYNMIKDVSTDEQTEEFFYRDVVSVRTVTESSNCTLKTGERLEQSKMFSLSVASGDRISVVINDPKIKATPDLESLGDQAIANIRAMLRQYKTVQQTA